MTKISTARLLGDIGGTNARFAWQAGAGTPLTHVQTLACAQHESLLEAIRHYLAQQGLDNPYECAIGIANPVIGDQVRMTNHHWSFSIAQLQQDLQLARLLVLNDFTALALALPDLPATDLQPIGTGTPAKNAPMALIGPGTGLGVSGLLADGRGGWLPVNGEGGHVTLAPQDARDSAVLDFLRRRLGHISAERALSGPGLVNLYHAAGAIGSVQAETTMEPTPAEVITRAQAGEPIAQVAVDLFCGFLGNVAGNLALTLGARGGVYIGGGIAPRLIDTLRQSGFRQRFADKGRMRSYLEPIPTWVIDTALSPALLGAARALDRNDNPG